jgi:hypothetical protein
MHQLDDVGRRLCAESGICSIEEGTPDEMTELTCFDLPAGVPFGPRANTLDARFPDASVRSSRLCRARGHAQSARRVLRSRCSGWRPTPPPKPASRPRLGRTDARLECSIAVAGGSPKITPIRALPRPHLSIPQRHPLACGRSYLTPEADRAGRRLQFERPRRLPQTSVTSTPCSPHLASWFLSDEDDRHLSPAIRGCDASSWLWNSHNPAWHASCYQICPCQPEAFSSVHRSLLQP